MTLRGGRQLNARLTALSNIGTEFMTRLGLRAVLYQKQLVAVRTGNTRRTIRLAKVTRRSATTSVQGAGAYLESGTRPHVIVPRKKRALRFKASGGVVFAKRVNHPGTKAQPFMVPGARKAISEADGLRDELIKKWNGAA